MDEGEDDEEADAVHKPERMYLFWAEIILCWSIREFKDK